MTELPRESLILCEGYHDRAFWKGWLTLLRCAGPQSDAVSGRPQRFLDPFGEPVKGGEFGFKAPSGRSIRIQPCLGNRVLTKLRERLQDSKTQLRDRIIVNVDSPQVAADGMANPPIQATNIVDIARRIFSDAAPSGDDRVTCNTGQIAITVVRWSATECAAEGVPLAQTLERLVSCAIVAAYPDRGPAVQRWLDGRPGGSSSEAKSHMWSYMAGWYAEHGCTDFLERIWDDPRIVNHLETHLRASGAWSAVEALIA